MSDLVPVGFPTIPELTDPNFVGAVQRDIDDLRRIIATLSGGGSSVGDIKMTGASSAPDGWLLCDGSAISRTTYSVLFGEIGTTFGAGDGSTTFNVPDLRGRVPAGPDGAAGRLPSNDALGQSAGAATVTLTTSEIPAHAHSVTDPGHTHIVPRGSGGPTGTGAFSSTFDQADMSSLSATTGISIQNTGGGGAHNNLQPYQIVNFVIKT